MHNKEMESLLKLLIIYSDRFGYKTSLKGLDRATTLSEEKNYKKCVVGFIHFEEKDEENLSLLKQK